MSDTFRDPALDAMKGKTIAYLPISLGFDMAQAWGGAVKEEANHYGMKFVSQDPNWSTDAMAQALTNLIAQKPEVKMNAVAAPDDKGNNQSQCDKGNSPMLLLQESSVS